MVSAIKKGQRLIVKQFGVEERFIFDKEFEFRGYIFVVLKRYDSPGRGVRKVMKKEEFEKYITQLTFKVETKFMTRNYTPENYDEFVDYKLKDGIDIYQEATPQTENLNHLVMGIAGEAGELIDAIKKHTMYGKPLDVQNVIEELGDLEFYMQGMRDALGIERERTIQANIDKLNKRYKKGYSNKEASERNDK